MKDVVLTWQTMTTKIAEFFDPASLWETVKLQLKLHLSKLNGQDWKEPLPLEEQDF